MSGEIQRSMSGGIQSAMPSEIQRSMSGGIQRSMPGGIQRSMSGGTQRALIQSGKMRPKSGETRPNRYST
jgi:hypothetical protein